MKKLMILFFIAIFLSLLSIRSIHAADFATDYDVSYAVAPTGVTVVTQNVTLTNKESNLYPTQYTIVIDSDHIKNIIAYDNKGVIKPHITQDKGKTTITLKFNEQVVGVGKQLPFTLRYEQSDIANLNGTIWDVSIPGIEDDVNINTYTVSLQTPPTFGPNAYIKPQPSFGRKWSKEQMIQGGINAAYGESQNYSVQLSYDLENDQLKPALYEIALPPDTEFQKVTIKSIDPKPKNLKRDSDGNWIAQFELTSDQKLSVIADLAVTTYIQPRTDFVDTTVISNAYTEKQKYWETDNDKIIALAEKYKTPKEIYDYVVSTLSYDYNRAGKLFDRKGAVAALQNPNASVCSEFTDLFIAIARAAGIPARELVGFAYTTNTKLRPLSLGPDVLHAWPEYYDATKKQWVQVDPTWGHTTKGINFFDSLDFYHIAFVIHGENSEYPYPAGSYKQGTTPKKHVSVAFSDTKQTPTQEALKTTLDIPQVITIGYPLQGQVIIQNTGGSTIPEIYITIESDPFPISIIRKETNIPPYGTVTIPLTIQTKGIIPTTKGKITVTANGQIATFFYDMKPMYFLLIPLGCIIAGILLLIWTLSKKR